MRLVENGRCVLDVKKIFLLGNSWSTDVILGSVGNFNKVPKKFGHINNICGYKKMKT